MMIKGVGNVKFTIPSWKPSSRINACMYVTTIYDTKGRTRLFVKQFLYTSLLRDPLMTVFPLFENRFTNTYIARCENFQNLFFL